MVHGVGSVSVQRGQKSAVTGVTRNEEFGRDAHSRLRRPFELAFVVDDDIYREGVYFSRTRASRSATCPTSSDSLSDMPAGRPKC